MGESNTGSSGINAPDQAHHAKEANDAEKNDRAKEAHDAPRREAERETGAHGQGQRSGEAAHGEAETDAEEEETLDVLDLLACGLIDIDTACDMLEL